MGSKGEKETEKRQEKIGYDFVQHNIKTVNLLVDFLLDNPQYNPFFNHWPVKSGKTKQFQGDVDGQRVDAEN